MPRVIEEGSPLWQFVGLEPTWESNGLKAPSQKMLDLADELLEDLKMIFQPHEMPHVEPTENNGLKLAWISKDFLLDIELRPGGVHEWSMSICGADSTGKTPSLTRLVATAAVYYWKKAGG